MKKFKLHRKGMITSLLVLCMIIGIGQYGLMTVNAEDGTTVTDPSSMTTWEKYIADTTENIGRIWTDKTVSDEESIELSPSGISVNKGDSDFLIALSALSSSSNITATSGGDALDIVLVLDTSGSMDYYLDYIPVYSNDLNTNSSYYIDVNGTYTEVSYSYRDGWYYRTGWNTTTVTPKTGENDTATGHVQFYQGKTKRLTALQTAVNSFIDSTAEANSSIDDVEKQHQISIVTFASSGNTSQDLTVCNDNNKAGLKSTINNLSANGATRADLGMNEADDVLNGSNARTNAQKVVIFFTDGVPTTSSSFSSNVANNAITTAKSLKDSDTLIYSIGVFESADPEDTTANFNAYMNGLSSNYPDATSYEALGDRAQSGDYYKAADDSVSLNGIFNEISNELTKAGYPTKIETESGDPANSGYVTFTDKLGDYMQVDEFKNIVFASENYADPDVEEDKENNIVTYTFEGETGNTLYPQGNLNSIIIQVKKSDDQKTGDVVTVKIPASMIPLRYYNVNINEDSGETSMDVTPSFPIRIFYGVSLKDGVNEALKTPDAALTEYIENNSENGKVSFYSNAYTPNKASGDTTAVFTPAENNQFYYFTEDTQLYADEDCTEKVKAIEDGQDYYYKRPYYSKNNDGTVTSDYTLVTLSGSDNVSAAVLRAKAKADSDGNYYIPSGSPRITRMNDTYAEKEKNATGTATEIINPLWDNNNSPEDIIVSLGNNGRLYLDVPGTLSITKSAVVADGFDNASLDGKDFEFAITLTDDDTALTGSYDGRVFDREGQELRDVTVENGSTVTLQKDETLNIYGLPAGAKYKVTESKMPAGFTQTSAVNTEGTIAAGEISNVSFVNTYRAVDLIVDSGSLFTGAKVLNGRDWQQSDSFTFAMSGDYSKEVTLTGLEKADGEKVVIDFGNITYTKPGIYNYTIVEKNPGTGKELPGITYSQAAYDVIVEVTDNHDGTMVAKSSVKKTSNDAGAHIEDNNDVADKTALFTNTFDAESVKASAVATKKYTDNSGGKRLQNNMFQFRMTPNDSSYPKPEDITAEADGSYIVPNLDDTVAFGNIEFTKDMEKQTFAYTLQEVIPEKATADNKYTVDGMTYDPSVYTVEFAVTIENGTVKVTTTYKDSAGNKLDRIVFENSYNVKPETLTGSKAIKGEKILTGRDMLSGEEFEFLLEADSDITQKAITDKDIVIDDGGDLAKVTGAENGKAEGFTFGDITFNKPGVYSFKMTEKTGGDSSIEYDDHTCAVVVTVEDKNGVLTASVLYGNGTGSVATDRGVFENVYTSSHTYSGINVSKTLNGRAMAAGEFTFTITPKDGAPAISAEDLSFVNEPRAGGSANVMNKLSGLTFDQGDAGKTYVYTIDEKDGTLGGITYDQSEYEAAIAVTDNNDGTMQTVTTVTMTKNFAGETASEVVGVYDSTEGEAATIPFVNTYKAGSIDVDSDTDATARFTKVFTGRNWLDTDKFEFTITPQNNAPAPTQAAATVTKPDSGNSAAFGFGTFSFDKAGTYKYTVSEKEGNLPGVTYSTNTATLTVIVTDDGRGQLTAVSSVANSTFYNSYSAEVDYGASGGVQISKTLNGRDMTAEQFEFLIKPADRLTADKLAIDLSKGMTVYNMAAEDGEAAAVTILDQLKFDQSDVGDTFAFTVEEIDEAADGYTYDSDVYTVTIKIEDKEKDGSLTAITTVSAAGKEDKVYTYTAGQPISETAVTEFENSYNAVTGDDGAATLEASKTLTGRQLKADEFSFIIKTGDTTPETVMTGSNDAEGTVTFEKAFEYDTASLKQAMADGYAVRTVEDGKYVYTLSYTAEEDTSALPAGVSAVAASFEFKVKVTDDGAGNLDAVINYPEGGISFENVYSTGDAVPVALSGSKVLSAAEGLTPDDITGKYTFTLTGENGAPMPKDTTVQNDAQGNIVFGDAEFDLELLEDAVTNDDGSRTRTFEYTVTESGTAAGVENDTEKSFSLTVKDDGEGHLTVTRDPEQGTLFTFINTYSVEPKVSSVTDSLKITKTIKGRDLTDEEFVFELVEGDKIVAEGTNDAEGKVSFGAISYEKPGTHSYILREKADDEDNGVTYDSSVYTVTAEVTDNGDGTLSVKYSTENDDVVFSNVYTPAKTSVVVGAAKVLKNGTLQDGQFGFELKDENGNVVSETANNDIGQIIFDDIIYDKVGTYKYTVSEIKGSDKNIEYDDIVYNVTVTVSDDGLGRLNAEITDDGNGSLVFTNTYHEAGSETRTGDNTPLGIFIILITAAAASALFLLRRKRS